jgi:hypothetical protein
VSNFQLAVCIVSASHAKAQFNRNFCPFLQDVSKTALLIKALLVASLCSQNGTEYITKRSGTSVTYAL